MKGLIQPILKRASVLSMSVDVLLVFGFGSLLAAEDAIPSLAVGLAGRSTEDATSARASVFRLVGRLDGDDGDECVLHVPGPFRFVNGSKPNGPQPAYCKELAVAAPATRERAGCHCRSCKARSYPRRAGTIGAAS